MNLIKKILPNKKLICAVSGGLDSVSSFIYLRKLNLVDTIYHFNHNYQPINSQMEEAVIELALDHKCNLILGKAPSGLKTESQFRAARFGFIFERSGLNLVTGHHLGDAVESYLQNCFTGNPEYKPFPLVTDFSNGNRVYHPFLLNEKRDLEEFAKKNKLEKYIVEDPTNHEVKGSRRVMYRKKILPILQEHQIGIEKIVLKKVKKYVDEYQKQD